MKKQENLRKLKVTTDSGTDVKDTSQLKGQASPTSAWKAKNDTNQYTTSGGVPKGSLGGLNTNS